MQINNNELIFMHGAKNVAISDIFLQNLYVVKEEERTTNGRMFCTVGFRSVRIEI